MAGLEKENKSISCQGESGSCAFAASRTHYFTYDSAPQPSFADVLRRVVEKDAQIGILPLENSKTGLIAEPLIKVANSDLRIVAEHWQPIRHDLLVSRALVKERLGFDDGQVDALASYIKTQRDTSPEPTNEAYIRSLLSQIRTIYSDDQGFKQCERKINNNVASAERALTSCTAKAARMLAVETNAALHKKSEIPAVAAIASEECATMFLNIVLIKQLNDDGKNGTRYFVVSREHSKPQEILRDLDLRDIRESLGGKLDALFSGGPLKTMLEDTGTALGLGATDSNPDQRANVQAEILYRHLKATPWDSAKLIYSHLPSFEQNGLEGPIKKIFDNIREHTPDEKEKQKISALAKSLKKNNRVRSIFVVRAKKADTTASDLVKPLVDGCATKGSKKKTTVDYRVLSELPPLSNPSAKDDKGIGLVIEAQGCLIDAEKRLNKDKKKGGGGAFFGGPSDVVEISDLERILQPVAKLGTIRVLGTFASEPRAKRTAMPMNDNRPGSARADEQTGGWGLFGTAAALLAAGCGAFLVAQNWDLIQRLLAQ